MSHPRLASTARLPSLSNALVLGALVFTLWCAAFIHAEPFPLDPVADIKKALDPDNPKIITEEQIENLRTLGDLGEAMLIINPAGDRLAPSLRVRLAERFEKAAREGLRNAELRSVTVDLLSDLALTERASSTRNLFLRSSLANLGPDIAKLTAETQPRVRQTAIRTLGNLEFDPQIILPPIERLLLNGKTAKDRRAAAEALGELARPSASNDFQSEVASVKEGQVFVPVGSADPFLLGQSLAVYAPYPSTAYLGRIQIVEQERDKEAVGKIIGEPAEPIKPGDRVSARVNLNNEVIRIASKKILAKEKEPDVTVRRVTIGAVEWTTNLALSPAREENERELANQFPLFQALRDNRKALAVAAEDPDGQVRLTALRALEAIGIMRERLRALKPAAGPEKEADLPTTLKEVVPALTRSLSDRDPRARIKAAEALETIADILGQGSAQSEEAVRALVRSLEDPSPFVRWAAARALGKVAPGYWDLILPGLTAALTQRDMDARMAVIAAVRRFGESQDKAATLPKRGTLDAAVLGLGRATGQGYPYVVVNGVYHGDSNVRLSAIRALDAIGTGAAPAIPDLILALDDDNNEVRQNVATVLGHFGKEAASARPALLRTIDDSDPEVRRAAADALLRIGKP
ncbi:MAG: HEAT repeat domain-containing protein [Gemmataceae bacterium]